MQTLSGSCLTSVAECLGGPYLATELRSTCVAFRRVMKAPQSVTLEELALKAAAENNVVVAEFALDLSGLHIFDAIICAASKGHFDLCDKIRARFDDVYKYDFERAIILGAVMSGTGHLYIDVVKPRYNYDIFVYDIAQVAIAANNVEILKYTMKNFDHNDEWLAVQIGTYMSLEDGISIIGYKSLDVHLNFVYGVARRHQYDDILAVMDRLTGRAPEAYRAAFDGALYNNQYDTISRIHDAMPVAFSNDCLCMSLVYMIKHELENCYKIMVEHIIPQHQPDIMEHLVRELEYSVSGGVSLQKRRKIYLKLSKDALKRYCSQQPWYKQSHYCIII